MTTGSRGNHGRIRLLVLSALVLALVGSALGIGLSAHGSRAAGPGKPASYCAAARNFDDYNGKNAHTVASLLKQVSDAAPAEIGPTLTTMRASRLNSATFNASKAQWSRYTTNHCCECIGGTSAPQVVSTAP